MMTLDRRRALALLGSGTAIGLPGVGFAQQLPGSVSFAHGVAAGDPAADGAIIWTRASAQDGFTGDIALRWMVSEGPGQDPVAQGEIMARAAADHTAKVDVAGLRPGREYHYWFETAAGLRSPEGRFRTLPVGDTEDVVLAVASCQLYTSGLFNALADIAALERVDAVIHLGDYIYEYGNDGFGSEIGQRIGRLVDPPHEIVTLADYRRRHAQVKADADSQAAHARAAFICVWDDHEITNDAWMGGAENHQPETEGDWAARKAVAMQAYFEWMPIRDPDPLRAKEAIFRSFEFGDLATLAMLETRLLVRSEQAAPKGDVPQADQIAGILAVRDMPDRELLGQGQRDWLESVLDASVKAGKPWQVLGNQVIMARVAGPDLAAEMGAAAFSAMRARMPAGYRAQIDRALTGFRAGVPFNLDAWDGYPHARDRLYRSFAKTGACPVVLSGDSHAAWSNNLFDDTGALTAIEIGCTAVTSLSYGSILPGLGEVLARVNDEVVYCDQESKGYSILRLTQGEAQVQHIAVSTVFAKPFTRKISAAFLAAPRGPLQAVPV